MPAFTNAGVVMVVEDLNKFLADVHKADTAVEGFGDATEEAADRSERAAKSTAGLGKRMAGVGKAMLGAGVAIGGVAVGLAKMAAPAEGIGMAFDKMSQDVGLSLEELRAASGNTIADLELMRSANIALTGAGEDLGREFGQNLPGLLNIARSAAIATGQSTEFMFQSLVTGVKRTSPMLIDNTGLQLKLGEANKRLAEQLGKSTEELTGEEKQIALLNATLEAGQKMVDDFGGGQQTAQESVQSLGAALANARDEIGSAFVPMLQTATSTVAKLATNFTKLSDPMKETIAKVTAVSTAVLLLGGGLLSVIPKIQAAVSALQAMGLASTAALGPIGLVAIALAGLAAGAIALRKLKEAHYEEAAAVYESSDSYEGYVRRIKDAGREAEMLTEELYDLAKAAGFDATEVKKASEELHNWVATMSMAGKLSNQYVEDLEDQIAAMSDEQLAVASGTDEMYGWMRAVGKSEEEARALTDALRGAAEWQELHRQAVATSRDETERWSLQAHEAVEVTKETVDTSQKLTSEWRGISSLRMGRTMKDYAEGAAQAAEDSEELAERMREVAQAAAAMGQEIRSTMTGGILEIRGLGEDAAESEREFNDRLAEMQDDLRDLEAQAAETKTVVRGEILDAFPDRTAWQDRARSGEDVWDEWVFRLNAIAQEGLGNQWYALLQEMGHAKPPDVGVQDWVADMKKAFYAGELPDLINKDAAAWQEHAAAVKDSQWTETVAVNEGAAERVAAKRQEIADLKAAREEQRAAEQQAMDEAKLRLALQLADASGMLDAWAQQKWAAPGLDLTNLDVSADEIADMLLAGTLELDASLRGMIGTASGAIDTTLDETQSRAEEFNRVLPDLFTLPEVDTEGVARQFGQVAADAQTTADTYSQSLGGAIESAQVGSANMAVAMKADADSVREGVLTNVDQMSEKYLDEYFPDMTENSGTLRDDMIEHGEEVRETWITAAEEILDAWEEAADDIEGRWNDLTNTLIKLAGDIRKAWEKVAKDIREDWKKLAADVRSEMTSALADVEQAVQDLGSTWSDEMDDMVEKTGGLINKVQELIEWFKRALDRKQQLEVGGPDMMDALGNSVGGVANQAWSLAEGFNRAALNMQTLVQPNIMVTAPAAVSPGSYSTSISNNFQSTINSEMDAAVFEARVEQVVRDAVRR